MPVRSEKRRALSPSESLLPGIPCLFFSEIFNTEELYLHTPLRKHGLLQKSTFGQLIRTVVVLVSAVPFHFPEGHLQLLFHRLIEGMVPPGQLVVSFPGAQCPALYALIIKVEHKMLIILLCGIGHGLHGTH